MVQTKLNFELFGEGGKHNFFINIFDKRVDVILEDVSVAKIIVQC